MLLVHDIAEAEIGDLRPGERTEPVKEREKQFYNSLRVSDTFEGFHGGRKALDLWLRFEFGKDLSARVAREIDKLECLVQLCKYKSDLKPVDFNFMYESLKSEIHSIDGKELLTKVQTHFGLR